MQQYVGFKLNENEYTIPILKVQEIINTPSITRLPQSPPYIRGVTNLRGKVIPIVDLRKLETVGETNLEATKVIVLSNNNVAFGILVDEITGVINIDESNIEPPEHFMQGRIERIEGVARFNDRMVIVLDTNKLVETDDLQFDESAVDAGKFSVAGEEKVLEIVQDSLDEAKKIQEASSPQGIEVVTGEEKSDTKELLSKMISLDERKNKFITTLLELLDVLAAHDYERADMLVSELLRSAEGELYNEVGRVTRKLHDSIREFKQTLNPRLKRIARNEVPSAVDSLQFVIRKTEEAANTTMEIVEKYLSGVSELAAHIEKVKAPEESVGYLKSFVKALNSDMTTILLAQEYQDITGQAIKKVIELINSIESELVGLIATFGLKLDTKPVEDEQLSERITQDQVEDLLNEFGF
jgi:chemotaxis protein CheZ